MLNDSRKFNWMFIFLLLNSFKAYPDSFFYNTYNNHGVIGLINTPSARFYDEGAFAVNIYDGHPDQKITITSSPYDWLESSFFYMNHQERAYPGFESQTYKDKGFNFKVRLKEEGKWPALAIGINDIAGTGFYSSEYLVASYGIQNLDLHFGIGWGTLNGDPKLNNPLTYLNDRFANRPDSYGGEGGQFKPSRYFSSKDMSPFYGISYVLNDQILLKIEHDTTLTPGIMDFDLPKTRTSFGFDYSFNKNFTIGFAKERGDHFSLTLTFKQDASSSIKPYKYNKVKRAEDVNDYGHLINSLEANGIGVKKITEMADSVGLELSQFSHPNLNLVQDIVKSAVKDSGIKKEIKTEYKVADLQAYSNIDINEIATGKLIYESKNIKRFNTTNRFSIRPYLAAREGFFKFAFLLENDSEYIIKDNLFFNSNLKYSIKSNFGDLTVPPEDVFPEQVRSDIKDYLRNFDERIIIGRAQFDYHLTPKKNNHLMFTAGILEEMFSGYGFEYLYFDNSKSFAAGIELFHVKKRDYGLRFGTLDYKTTTGFVNAYYRNYKLIPFDAKFSFGKYLAGDNGATFEISRSYLNGAKFGVFASFTDVTAEEYGEGSFDKGIFFNIPIYKNFVNYSWRPLTKDPGAKLIRKHTLHDLLVKFQPYND